MRGAFFVVEVTLTDGADHEEVAEHLHDWLCAAPNFPEALDRDIQSFDGVTPQWRGKAVG